jgi:thiol-disulfide isomerase/thioredoxin
MQRIFIIIFKIIISVLFFTLLSSIGSLDNRIKSVSFFFLYYILLFILSDRENSIENVSILLFPIFFLEVPLRIATGFQESLITLTSSVLPVCIGIGLFFINKSRTAKLVVGIFGLMGVLVFNIFFFNNWVNFFENDSLSGKVDDTTQYDIKFRNCKLPYDTIYIKNTPQIIVADFWTESCAACFKGFPEFRELKDRCFLNSHIRFITALNASRPDYTKYARRIDSLYELDTYIVNDSIAKQCGIFSYPTIVIFRNGKIIFRGSKELSKAFLDSEKFKDFVDYL